MTQAAPSQCELDHHLVIWCGEGKPDRVKALLDQGANPDGPDEDGRPLSVAVRGGRTAIITQLLHAGARPALCESRVHGNLLHVAATALHIEDRSLVELLAQGVSLAGKDFSGRTPIEAAVHRGNQARATVMGQPITTAAAHGWSELCVALLERGHPWEDGALETALHRLHMTTADALRCWRQRQQALQILGSVSPLTVHCP